MEYTAVILSGAEKDLDRLSPPIRTTILRRIKWLCDNAEAVIHHPLVGMPSDLSGLCKFRIADYRVLYWKVESKKEIHVFRIRHRSEVYKKI